MRVSIQQKIIKKKVYSIVIIGILLFQCIFISVNADPSQGRWGHTSILINNRLYVYGGEADTSNILNEFISLDVSGQFGTDSPPWVVLPPSSDGTGVPPPLAFHSCSFGGSQKELFIMFGGKSYNQVNSLFIYNTTESKWSVPSTSTTGASPKSRGNHTMVTRESDSATYLWGGTPVTGDGEEVTALNELFKLDTITLSWNALSQNPGRWDHSATLLNNGKMYIIGGMVSGGLAPMIEIPIYDTNEDNWSSTTAVGDTIPQRRSHRAVGTNDNRIIIYGGTTAEFDDKFSDIAVLNVTDSALTWSRPSVTGSTPPGRYAHSMTLVGSKAIVAYGSVDEAAGRNLFVFNVNSYEWEPTYNPDPTITAPISPTNTNENISSGNKSNNILGVIVGVPVAGVVIVLALGLLFYWFRKRKNKSSFSATPYEKQQPSIPPISGPPSHNLNNFGSSSPSQDGVDVTPFIPPFATSSYQRRQPSFGSINETRNLTPVDQHDSWGSAPNNNSQPQLPQINSGAPLFETNDRHSPTIPKTSSPFSNVPYLPSPSPTSLSQNIPPTPPSSTPTPPPVFPTGASHGSKTSSTNLRLDSDSNTAPVELDYNPPPVAPLFINRMRTPSPSQAQAQQQLTTPSRLPISTSSSSTSLPKDSTNVLASSPTEMETIETNTTSTEDEGGTSGLFNSPLFRTEALSSYAGTAATASPTDRSFSLRSVPRLNTQSTPRNSFGLSSPPNSGGRLRSGTLDGQRNDGNVTDGSRPTSPRLFGSNTDLDDDY